ncbi:MAG: alanine--tRNA ligase [Thomasclavelia sp.]|jgi:alanyl-tRNA synthetase|nr:alanine--tRNA ligase [Thomasclavelia sp.]
MKQLTGNQVRQMFLDFFESKGHKVEPSHSLIPQDDPTILWINAGVAALKKYFDGSVKPENPRITNAQKSIRTNDIENVGRTSRHQTFFEMLGNFSIGDYFKEEAIDFAWELLTSDKWFGMDKDKLYITVHDKDEDAYNFWTQKHGVAKDHMLKTPENFWEIGEGPCGPDSEIFFDRGEEYDPEHLGTKLFYDELENDRYIEIWNLVFSQFNSQEGVAREDYKELPQKNIDTGMGLERIVSIIQGGETNFDTDFFLPIIHETEKLAKQTYKENPMAYRVIADHIRTVTFALADGAMFDNVGRGYVLRRILRRAVRYGKQIGIEDSFMYSLVNVVSDVMKEFYDYLPSKVDMISSMVKKEEESFHKTLNRGEKMIQDLIDKNTTGSISGEDAFKLYDTYGFPFELTLEIANESNITISKEDFEKELAKQQDRSRNAREDAESMNSQKEDLMNFTKTSKFVYDGKPLTAKVIGLFKDGNEVDELSDCGEIIFDTTNFYAEMGGQCADTGKVFNDDVNGEVVNVLTAPNKQHMHFVKINEGSIKIGDSLTLEIDADRRRAITANHTATHILQRALKDILGDHINQAGSYVDEKRLRFDFTHFEKINNEDLNKIEEEVNTAIFKALKVNIDYMDKKTALKTGAMALFDEKYGDTVRVVSVGDYSVELCGGCHVENSSDIGLFRIISEESVGSGVRRIEAVTNKAAYLSLVEEKNNIDKISSLLKLKNRNEVVNKVENLVETNNDLNKELKAANEKLSAASASSLMDKIETINDIKCLFVTENIDSKDAKQLAFDLRDKIGNGVVVVVSTYEDKTSYFVAITKDLTSNYKAGNLVKEINEVTSGRGGGKPDFAQGGCPKFEDYNSIFESVKKIL